MVAAMPKSHSKVLMPSVRSLCQDLVRMIALILFCHVYKVRHSTGGSWKVQVCISFSTRLITTAVTIQQYPPTQEALSELGKARLSI